MGSLLAGSYSLTEPSGTWTIHCSWLQISSSHPCVCRMTVPQHPHTSWLKAGNWSQLLVVWVTFPSAALRAQDRADPVTKNEKGQPQGPRVIVSDRGYLLNFGTVASLGIQLKQKGSYGLFALLISLLQQLLRFCVPGDPWGGSNHSQHCHWDVVSWHATKEKDNSIPCKMKGTKAYGTSHWRNRHFSLFFPGVKHCLTSLRPLRSWFFEAPSTGLDMRYNF